LDRPHGTRIRRLHREGDSGDRAGDHDADDHDADDGGCP